MTPRRAYPALALGLLAAGNAIPAYALLVLGPDVAATLGIGPATLGAFGAMQGIAFALAALGFASAGARRPRRAALSVGAAAGWSAASAATAVAAVPAVLAGSLVVDGAAGASIRALHPALLADVHARSDRMRALSLHRAVAAAGGVLAPLLVALLTSAGLTWRGVFLTAAAISAATAFVALGVRDPGTAAHDPRLRPAPGTPRPALAGALAAVLGARGVRRVLLGYALAGAFGIPFAAYLAFYLEDVWGLSAGERGAVLAAAAGFTATAALLWAPTGDRLLAGGGAALTRAAWQLALAGVVTLPIAVLAPWFGVMSAGLAVLLATLAIAQIALTGVLVSAVAPELRVHAAAAAGIAYAAVGGLGGLLAVQGLDEPLGPAGALAALAAPGLAAVVALRSAVALIAADEAELGRRLARRVARAGRRSAAPALACDDLTVAYDGRVAIDHIDLTVRAGERVALLGTNGAGKSTLLRALAGLLVPAGGEVRLGAADVTALTAEQRAGLGLRLVLGGHGVFGTLTPREALALAVRAAAAAPGAASAALAAFAPLAARADVPAARLSGGEQHMLALAQALVARPRVLLVDELSLGLAPAAVDGLIERLRGLCDDGVTLLVAEQSVDIACRLADRVVFLDAGTVRFDGPAAAFTARDDLPAPAFLKGWGASPLARPGPRGGMGDDEAGVT